LQPYEENEDVLVESSCGKLLWNAKIVGISQAMDSNKVNGYRVHYDEWSSRFDEWVDPFRVVEPVQNNIEVQVSYEYFHSRNVGHHKAPLLNSVPVNFLYTG
jgi:hypothetical protein